MRLFSKSLVACLLGDLRYSMTKRKATWIGRNEFGLYFMAKSFMHHTIYLRMTHDQKNLYVVVESCSTQRVPQPPFGCNPLHVHGAVCWSTLTRCTFCVCAESPCSHGFTYPGSGTHPMSLVEVLQLGYVPSCLDCTLGSAIRHAPVHSPHTLDCEYGGATVRTIPKPY